jgi:hypothetical protein
MPSPGLLPPDAIRIEDEVWQEAFTRRESARSRADRHAASDPVPRPASTPARSTTSPTGRRTVTITGRGAERHLPWPGDPGHRPARRAHERAGFRPDRVAMWAVLLGVLLIAVAIASAHG